MFIPWIAIVVLIWLIYKLAKESKDFEEQLNELDGIIRDKFNMSRDEFVSKSQKPKYD